MFLIICQPVRCSPVPVLVIQPKFYSKSIEFRKRVIGGRQGGFEDEALKLKKPARFH